MEGLSFVPPPTDLSLIPPPTVDVGQYAHPCIPPPTADVGQYAHPCSPSVHDCAYVSGGVMNTYEVAPDPYVTVRRCLDDRRASGFHESCSVSCDQQGSGP
eukprot:6345626-Amphidinium_carterae.1